MSPITAAVVMINEPISISANISTNLVAIAASVAGDRDVLGVQATDAGCGPMGWLWVGFSVQHTFVNHAQGTPKMFGIH